MGALRLLSIRPSTSLPRSSVPPPGYSFVPAGRPPVSVAACRPGPRSPLDHAVVLLAEEMERSPRFLGSPCARAPFPDPGGSTAPGHSARRCCLPLSSQRQHPQPALSGLNSAAHALPVYASPYGHPSDATLGSGWWPALPGGTTPQGCSEDFPRLQHGSLLPGFCLAHGESAPEVPHRPAYSL